MKEAGEKEQCKRQRCNATIEPDGHSEAMRRLSRRVCKRSAAPRRLSQMGWCCPQAAEGGKKGYSLSFLGMMPASCISVPKHKCVDGSGVGRRPAFAVCSSTKDMETAANADPRPTLAIKIELLTQNDAENDALKIWFSVCKSERACRNYSFKAVFVSPINSEASRIAFRTVLSL